MGGRPFGEGGLEGEHIGFGLGRVGVGCSLLEAGGRGCGIGVRRGEELRMVLGVVRRIRVRAGVVRRSPVGGHLVGEHRSRVEEDIGLGEGLEGRRIVVGDREVVGDIEAVARSGPEEEADRMRRSPEAVLDNMQVNTIALFEWGKGLWGSRGQVGDSRCGGY